MKQEAKRQNKPIEIASLHTENSTTVANPDGKTLGTYVYTQPVRVKQGGTWKAVDTTLVAENGVVKPRAVKLDISLSDGGDTTLLTAKGESLGVEKGKAGEVEIAAPSALPAPRLSGNRAVYESAYGRGVDMVVTVTPAGFHREIVIRERPGRQLTLPISADLPSGMSYGKSSSGAAAVLAGEKPVTELATVRMLDATAAEAPGSGRVGAAKTAVELKKDGPTLVLSPDAGFLADPQVTYPVTLAADGTEWYGAGYPDDTFINNKTWGTGAPNQHMYKLLVGNGGNAISNGPTNDPSTVWRSYLRFNLTGAPFMGQTILNADLRPWNYRSHACGDAKGNIVVRRITSTWSINSLSWNAQPTVTTSGEGVKGSAVGDHCSGDLTSRDVYYTIEGIVRDWSAGQPNHGLRISALQEGGVINWREFRSANYADFDGHPPHLYVKYESPAEIHTLITRPRSSNSPLTLDQALAIEAPTQENPPNPPATSSSDGVNADQNSPWEYGLDLATISPPEGTTPEEIAQGPTNLLDGLPPGWEDDPNVPSGDPELPHPSELRAHWKFDEGVGSSAADSSGQNHNATVNNTTTWSVGKTGNAVSNVSSQEQKIGVTPSGESPTPSRSTVLSEATKLDKPVEVAAETSETSITYAQPDGKTFKTEVAAGPVRTKQNGAWVPIDASLIKEGGVLTPKAIAQGTVVEVSTGGTSAFVKMTTADRQNYALQWPTALPKPTVNKNVATFTNAAGRGADLVVTVLPTGFRHDVVLREQPAKPLEIRIGVQAEGLTLSEGKGGRLLLTGDKGKKLMASAPQPVMWDASAGVRLAQGRLPQARHAKITTDVVTTDGKTELVLKPDHAFLSDPATKYPVRVDPTTTLPANNDVEVNNVFNTAGSPADPTGPLIMAGTWDGNEKYRVHLRFDTAPLTGTTVTDAKLSLLNMDSSGCGTTVGAGIQVRRLTSAWDENNLDWANKPTSTTEDAQINRAGFGESCASGSAALEWPVTGIAQDWAAGAANHGLVLQSPSENNVTNYRVLTSSEDTDFNNPPKLTVTTTGPASTPAVSTLTITPAQNSGGITTVTSLTPQLAATVSDTIGGTLTGQFEIEHDPAATGQGTGQIWTGTSTAVASGSPATATVPAAKLIDGWKVRWRARASNTAASTTSAWSAWQMVTIDEPGPVSNPAIGALQVNPSKTVDGKTVTSTLTPSLLAQVSDPASGSLRAEYELEHDPASPGQGTGQIWTGAIDNVASGAQARLTIPVGKLTDGWLVRWRARAVAGQLSSAWSDWQQLTVDVVQPGEEPLAQTATSVIRTDQSFAIAAWLRWSDKDGNYNIIEQKGTHTAPFRLGNTADHGLVFTLTSEDTAGATTEGVLSGVEPPVNEWFHLAGVYDAASKTATLYLNGSAIKTESIAFDTWNADTQMTLGTSMRGYLDDVLVYQRWLAANEISALYEKSNDTGTVVSQPASSTSALSTKSSITSSADDWEECRNDNKGTFLAPNEDRNRPDGWNKNRLQWCFWAYRTVFLYEKRGSVKVVLASGTYRVTLIGQTSNINRSFTIKAKIDEWEPDPLSGAVYNDNTMIGIGALSTGSLDNSTGTPTASDCRDQNAPTPQGEFAAKNWPHNEVVMRFKSEPNEAQQGIEKRHRCTVTFTTWATVSGMTKSKTWDEPKALIRCDTASYISQGYAKNGGCVFQGVAPSVMVGYGDGWDEQTAHLETAKEQPSQTIPRMAGKLILGFDKSTMIERCAKDRVCGPRGLNRAWARKACREEWGWGYSQKYVTLPNGVSENQLGLEWDGLPDHDGVQGDCDEFPFNATYNGSYQYKKGLKNFSVRVINGEQNQNFGSALNKWFNRERILDHDKFFVRIKD